MAKRQYSHAHQTMRRDLDPLVQTGEVDCWRCGEAIEPGTPWDLGHDDLDPEQYRGPEHQRCNRATKGRAPNQPAAIPFAPSGRCAPRDCEVCASEYRPTYSAQRTCGRACGAELQRRNRPPKGRSPKAQTTCVVHFKTCAQCASLFATRAGQRKFCGSTCAEEANRARVRMRYTPKLSAPCTECGASITPSRKKCDDCKRAQRQRYRAAYRKSESGKIERRRYEQRRDARRREGRGSGVAAA